MSHQININYSHLRILFKHILNSYLDREDCLSVLRVTNEKEFDIANLLNVDLKYENDYALRYASEIGIKNVVQYLVEKGADIHTHDDYSLRWASKGGHLPVVQYLLEKGANVGADNDYSQMGKQRWTSSCC